MGSIIPILIGLALAAGVAFIIIKNRQSDSGGGSAQAPPPQAGWQQQFGNVAVDPATGNFTFGEPHYIVRAAPKLQAGQTITMRFRIDGTGQLISVQDGGQASVTLYMQRAGDNLSGAGVYQQYRYFGATAQLNDTAEHTLSCQLNPDQWGDVFGQRGSYHPAEFAACVANAAVIGFVFGNPGAGATGHGAAVKAGMGTASFTLLDFSVG